jgi:protein tyrosine phosphatase
MGDYVDTLKSIFVEAAKLAKVIPNNLFKLKKYKCPDLTQARDTKRFWWRLWSDNGRPREGEVYKCYKNVKKLFRESSRQKQQIV